MRNLFGNRDLYGKGFKDKRECDLHNKRVKDKRDKDLYEKSYEN